MRLLAPYWHHLSGCGRQLFQLQLTMLLGPLVGGTGFLLVVPAVGFIIEPVAISNPQLAYLVSLLPETPSLSVVLLLFLALLILGAGLSYWQVITSEVIEQKMVTGIRKDIYRAAMNANITVIGRYHQSDYTRIVIDEAGTVTDTFDLLIELATLLITVLIYTAMCFFLSPAITFIAVVLGALLLLITIPMQGMIAKVGSSHLEASETLYRRTSDQIKGIKHIKSSSTAALHESTFNAAAASVAREELNYTRATSRTQFAYSIFSALVFCTITYLAIEVYDAELAVVVILALIFSRILPQVNRLRTIFQRLAYFTPRLEELYDRLEQLKQFADPTPPSATSSSATFSLHQGIQLRNISYQYPDADEPALRDFSADLAPHQLIALTGPSGIGKSTLVDMLSGLLLPQTGEIQVGDTLIDATNQLAWRTRVSYVPQTPFLIESSIRDNLNLLSPVPASDPELTSVLKQAAAEFVFDLPQQLDTIIGDDGVTLSVGQRQRLEFARALLDQRPVMILDETTSNLDPENEARIISTLQQLKQQRLIIIVSHRPSIAATADLVLTINDKPTP